MIFQLKSYFSTHKTTSCQQGIQGMLWYPLAILMRSARAEINLLLTQQLKLVAVRLP